MNTLDRVILEQYVLFDTPADQIVSDPNVSAVFRDAVNQHLGDGEQVDDERRQRSKKHFGTDTCDAYRGAMPTIGQHP